MSKTESDDLLVASLTVSPDKPLLEKEATLEANERQGLNVGKYEKEDVNHEVDEEEDGDDGVEEDDDDEVGEEEGEDSDESEVEENVGEEILKWREYLKSTESAEVTGRWYLKWWRDVGGAIQRRTPRKPLTVRVGNGILWTAIFDTTAVSVVKGGQDENEVPSGRYLITTCVSLKNLDMDSLSRINFELFRLNDENQIIDQPNPLCTVLEGDTLQELKEFKDQEYARFQFQSQVDLDSEGFLRLDIKAISAVETSLEFHYLEITPSRYVPLRERNYKVLYGNAIPAQIINITQPAEKEPKLARRVLSYSISDSGTIAATFSISMEDSCVELWVISPTAFLAKRPSFPEQGEPQQITIPFASVSFVYPPQLRRPADNFPILGLAVSYSGSKIMLNAYQILGEDERYQTMLFKCNPRAPKDGDISQPWPLERSSPICEDENDLKEVYGIGCFTISDKKELDLRKERYIFMNGYKISVYDTSSEPWKLMYRIAITLGYNHEWMWSLMGSIQGRFMAWFAWEGMLSVWDIETGKDISHFSIGQDTAFRAVVSADGSMVLVATSGKVSLFHTRTGIRLGVYKEGLSMGFGQEVAFNQHYFTVQNVRALTVDDHDRNLNCRSVVRTSDMSIVKNVVMHSSYKFSQKGLPNNPVLAYRMGAMLNLKRFGNELMPPSEDICDDDCEMVKYEAFMIDEGVERVLIESASGDKFVLVPKHVRSNGETILAIKILATTSGGTTNSIRIPLGSKDVSYQMLFHPESSKLILMTGRYVHIWRLSAKDKKIGTLESIRRFIIDYGPSYFICETLFEDPTACVHGRRFTFDVLGVVWMDPITVTTAGQHTGVDPVRMTIPKTEEDQMPYTEDERIKHGVEGLIPMYLGGDVSCRNAIVELLRPRIRPASNNETSCIVEFANLWTDIPGSKEVFELLFVELLRFDIITWIPDAPNRRDRDPVRIMLEKAKVYPSARFTIERIIDYCVVHALNPGNLAFLAPLFANMKQIMELYPESAIKQLARVAHVPVPHWKYILNHHIIVEPPKTQLQFWKRTRKTLTELSDPVMQFQYSGAIYDRTNEVFKKGLYMASFDALWYHHGQITTTTTLTSDMVTGKIKTGPAFYDEKKHLAGEEQADSGSELGEAIEVVVVEAPVEKTNWIKAALCMLLGIFQLRMHTYVECYDFSLEYFDNPAIAALVAYKWNTIGFNYWMVRFVSQCAFYSLVVIAALMQVYHNDPSQLVGLFVTIIILAIGFLWLEFLQALQSWTRYEGSMYNILDIVTFLLPLAGSAVQLFNIYTETDGNIQVISFSVLAVALHLLLELRIIKSVCKYVTIIQKAIVEIQVFFIVFAFGILVFAIATLHMTTACAYRGDCKACLQDLTDPTSPGNCTAVDFPKNLFFAVSATYFFMSGRYDPVSNEFTDMSNWGFQIMMIAFFFFTVILMMNVLISLVNVAFDKGGDDWRLVWIESRLRYIESAENMSYHIPGFRQTYNCFPDVIYYTATEKQVKEYRDKYFKTSPDDVLEKVWSYETDESIFKEWASDSRKENGDKNEEEDEEDQEESDEEVDSENDENDENKESASPKGNHIVEEKEKQEGGGSNTDAPDASAERDGEKNVTFTLVEQDLAKKDGFIDLKTEIKQLNQKLADQQQLLSDQQKLLVDQQKQAQTQFIELRELLLQQQAMPPRTILGD
ncbi:hypothetical protein BGZ99_001790 [Dissophora globulifera]|uniref:Ion transport domain-containing protein n=1 Tax=Dissophora globulifera TaxID=979702 RepID=A0A9P6UXW8_9FUNG|nr:hypothetical protein BGZ99_001790 [Dissophora globulifera]